MELLGARDVQVEEAGEREIHLGHLAKVQAVSRSSQMRDISSVEGLLQVVGEARPVLAAQLHEGSEALAARGTGGEKFGFGGHSAILPHAQRLATDEARRTR
ncbi:hypothetical protein GCM10009595_11630 [Falsarthrobacter nasiphocae]